MVRFLTGLIVFWSYNIGAWAAAALAVSLFLGATDEMEAFFRANRSLSGAFMLIHFVLCTIIYHARQEKMAVAQSVKDLKNARD